MHTIQKLSQKALEDRIIAGLLEVEYGPDRHGLCEVRQCGSGKTRKIRVLF
jgi:hypothetical protein